jgi:hypothetical protein
MSGSLLAELPEDRATGAVAIIYEEIRRLSGVPYVSSLQRYLATMPGVLEWAWAAIRPAMVSGVIPETGWRLADSVRLTPLPPVPEAVREAWKLDMGDYATIGVIAENFVRVSPVNLLPPMPGNADPVALPPEQRAVLMRFATEVDGTPFIPALYRQLARFPAFLAWLAEELVPRLTDPETNAARAAFRAAAGDAAPAIVARLRGVSMPPAPDARTTQRILATIDRYAETSPEMTMFGRLVLDVI